MKKKKEKNTDEISAVEEDLRSELEQPMWSVVSFDRCEASGLAYSDAVRTLEKLEQEKIAGLCIVTDEAAARLPQPGR